MEKTIISVEELNQLKAFKIQQNQLAFALGENRIQKEKLLATYRNFASQEQELYVKLSTKYGDGSLDLNTGEIIPLDLPTNE